MDVFSILIEQFGEALTAYFSNLDWVYIITLIFVSEILNRAFPDKQYTVFKVTFRFPVRYRVPALGLFLAVFFFFLTENQGKTEIRLMLQSMVAAMVLHLWFLDKLIQRYLPRPKR